MKFSFTAFAVAASIFGTTIAAPTTPVENLLDKRQQPQCKGHAHLAGLDWHASGGGYNRWKWAFAGFSCGEFHDSLNRWSLPNDRFIANRQCWDSGDGITFFMEHTTTKGEAIDGNVAASVVAVTGQGCTDLALPDWAIGPCGDNVLHPAATMCRKW